MENNCRQNPLARVLKTRFSGSGRCSYSLESRRVCGFLEERAAALLLALGKESDVELSFIKLRLQQAGALPSNGRSLLLRVFQQPVVLWLPETVLQQVGEGMRRRIGTGLGEVSSDTLAAFVALKIVAEHEIFEQQRIYLSGIADAERPSEAKYCCQVDFACQKLPQKVLFCFGDTVAARFLSYAKTRLPVPSAFSRLRFPVLLRLSARIPSLHAGTSVVLSSGQLHFESCAGKDRPSRISRCVRIEGDAASGGVRFQIAGRTDRSYQRQDG